jgi:retinol dehydrogenase 12
VGYELAKLLCGQGGNVYIAARSSEKVNRAIKNIEASLPSSRGRLAPLLLDLADFPTIKKAVNEFLHKENRLDVLVHNAGLMTPPAGSKSPLVSLPIIGSCDFER